MGIFTLFVSELRKLGQAPPSKALLPSWICFIRDPGKSFFNCYLVRFWPRWPSSTVLIYPFTKNTSLDPNHVTFLFTLSASFELVCFSNFSQSNFDKLVFQLWFHFQCFVQDMLALIWVSHCLIFQLVSSSHSETSQSSRW